jgi:hypothetical protein
MNAHVLPGAPDLTTADISESAGARVGAPWNPAQHPRAQLNPVAPLRRVGRSVTIPATDQRFTRITIRRQHRDRLVKPPSETDPIAWSLG